jgi:MurNAc alpha-1-phosphate uridylyltransferase
MKTLIKTAMVMAAGHGTRMRPLTNDRSKAMVEVGGKPLIDHMLDRLMETGIERAIVNVHAHADHLENHLRKRPSRLEIIISDERDALLETGGGVVKALPLLGIEPILICNIDAIWIEFAPVLKHLQTAWDPAKMDELLLLARKDMTLGHDGAGDFDLAPSGHLCRRSGEMAQYYYSGVQIFKPSLAQGFPEEKFSRNEIWDASLAARGLFGTVMPAFWMHVGDPRAKIAAEAVLKQAHHI